jgi:2-succinyl-6-hydroxy-2,4-cyclohexadiene-1-carboxylate synthase
MTMERPTLTEWNFLDSAPQSDAPVCALLHGFMGGPNDWTDVIRHFGAYRCLLGETPNIALDPGAEQTAETLASAGESAVEAAAEQLSNKLHSLTDRRVHLVGYSMGARIALAAASIDTNPIASLTLISGSPGIENMERRVGRVRWDRENAQKLRTESLRSFLEDWYQMSLFRNLGQRPSIRQKLIESKLGNDPAQLADQVLAYSPGRMRNYWPQLSSLHVPVLVVAGADDAKYCQITEDLGSRVPDVRTRVIPGAGHVLPMEAPDALGAHCHQFMRNIERR